MDPVRNEDEASLKVVDTRVELETVSVDNMNTDVSMSDTMSVVVNAISSVLISTGATEVDAPSVRHEESSFKFESKLAQT